MWDYPDPFSYILLVFYCHMPYSGLSVESMTGLVLFVQIKMCNGTPFVYWGNAKLPQRWGDFYLKKYNVVISLLKTFKVI